MIKTFRAKSIQQALELVRRELGADASVLHTRRLNTGLVGRLLRRSEVEVAATAAEPTPSPPTASAPSTLPPGNAVEVEFDHRQRLRSALNQHGVDLVADPPAEPAAPGAEAFSSLSAEAREPVAREIDDVSQPAPTALFDAFTTLIEAEIDEAIGRELLDAVRAKATPAELADPALLENRLRAAIEAELAVSGPIQAGQGGRRVVALVGPTGVGKTTTLAKLAANFRLRQKLRVGLITVDTYRVAAVEQLRTYADIIDLPLEVVSTPREMRTAIERFADLDLVLLDTAGRSPRDEVKIQELKSILAEAAPDEVHLVLSVTSSAGQLTKTAERFAGVGVTSVLLTKLDEAATLGAVVSLARKSGLPLSYLTNGQNVPDDIAVAQPGPLARAVIDPESDPTRQESRR